jgi:hypothetical protein
MCQSVMRGRQAALAEASQATHFALVEHEECNRVWAVVSQASLTFVHSPPRRTR